MQPLTHQRSCAPTADTPMHLCGRLSQHRIHPRPLPPQLRHPLSKLPIAERPNLDIAGTGHTPGAG